MYVPGGGVYVSVLTKVTGSFVMIFMTNDPVTFVRTVAIVGTRALD